MSRIEEAIEKANKQREQVKTEEFSEETPSRPNIDTFKTDISIRTDNPYLVTITEPDSPVTEEYRKLKSMVVKFTTNGGLHNTIMVTSTVGSEGKSITSLNLAITLAQEYDHTVLLVDADLRMPSIHKYLGIEPEIGLSDCLTNDIDVSKALIKTGIGKLVFLPSGTAVSNPVELLSSKKMKDLIKELKHRYGDRYVIFDMPPVLPFAEAHSIGSVVDGVVFVVREGHAPVNDIKEALSMLKDSNMLGVVFNDVDGSFDSTHYYYNYYRHYKAGYNKRGEK